MISSLLLCCCLFFVWLLSHPDAYVCAEASESGRDAFVQSKHCSHGYQMRQPAGALWLSVCHHQRGLATDPARSSTWSPFPQRRFPPTFVDIRCNIGSEFCRHKKEETCEALLHLQPRYNHVSVRCSLCLQIVFNTTVDRCATSSKFCQANGVSFLDGVSVQCETRSFPRFSREFYNCNFVSGSSQSMFKDITGPTVLTNWFGCVGQPL